MPLTKEEAEKLANKFEYSLSMGTLSQEYATKRQIIAAFRDAVRAVALMDAAPAKKEGAG